MAPIRTPKMKQACAASPGKFAAALLDILDGTIDSPSPAGPAHAASSYPMSIAGSPAASKHEFGLGALKFVAKVPTPSKPTAALKRPAAAVVTASAGTASASSPAKRTKMMKDEEAELDASKMALDRSKELRLLKLAKVREIAVRKSVDVDSKEKMIEGIIASEAKHRATVRRHRANARDVIVKKREEFDGKTNKELKELLQAYALTTGGTKPERVQRLLKTWQEQGEIEKVLVGMAYQTRKAELSAMDKNTLYDLCRKKGVDGLSKNVLVDRLLLHESVEIWQEVVEAGRQMEGRDA